MVLFALFFVQSPPYNVFVVVVVEKKRYIVVHVIYFCFFVLISSFCVALVIVIRIWGNW